MNVQLELTEDEADFLDGAFSGAVDFARECDENEEFIMTLARKIFGENWEPWV